MAGGTVGIEDSLAISGIGSDGWGYRNDGGNTGGGSTFSDLQNGADVETTYLLARNKRVESTWGNHRRIGQ